MRHCFRKNIKRPPIDLYKSDKPQAATLNSLGPRNYRQKPESPPYSGTINYTDIVIIKHCYGVIVDVSFKDVKDN